MIVDRVRVFVGGPIQYALDSDGSFHAPTRAIIESIVTFLGSRDVCVFSAHVYEQYGALDVTGRSLDVCARDFNWMRDCHVFVAVLPLDEAGRMIWSSGTAVELGWASALGKPIVLVRNQRTDYGHLIAGLGAVATVTDVDIDLPDRGAAVYAAVCRCCDSVRDDIERFPGVSIA